MKKLLLILTVVIVASCKTENVYLTVFPIKRITEITDTIYVVPDNRFKKDFHIIYMSVKNVVVIKLPHTQTKVLLPLLLNVVVVG